MEPFDALTVEELAGMRQYIFTYAKAEPHKVLDVWNKNKRTLFKAFGKKLRISYDYVYDKPDWQTEDELRKVYRLPNCYSTIDLDNFKDGYYNCRNEFLNDFMCYLHDEYHEKHISFDDVRNIYYLFVYNNILKGTVIGTYTITYKDKSITIPHGSKIIKSIQKVINFIGYPKNNLFETWRNAISNITTNKKVSQKLVLSIHPADFMTMSDNNCSWHSCMSWTDRGSYSSGTIEMMNSNMVVCAYLESTTPFEPVENVFFPNKSWRMLLYVHKQIIATGKHYPTHNKDAAIFAMTKMRELVEQNLEWHYKFINQEYNDLINIYSNDSVKRNIDIRHNLNYKGERKHSIYIYTNAMYNDLIEDHDYHYWCCRNYVKNSLKLCASGPLSCMCCGKTFDADSLSHHGQKICPDCLSYHTCRACDITSTDRPVYMIEMRDGHIKKRYCFDCIKKMYYNTEKKYFIQEKDLYDYVAIVKLNTHISDSEMVMKYHGIAADDTNVVIKSFIMKEKECNNDYVVIDRTFLNDLIRADVVVRTDWSYNIYTVNYNSSLFGGMASDAQEEFINKFQHKFVPTSEIEDLYGLIDTLRRARLSENEREGW